MVLGSPKTSLIIKKVKLAYENVLKILGGGMS